MRRAAPWMLLAMGLLLVSSAFAHALLGWPAVRGELVASSVPGDSIKGIGIGWLYGSASMLTFGLIVLIAWWSVRAGDIAAVKATVPISILYLGFGTAAWLYSSFDPHFLLGFMSLGTVGALAAYVLRRTP